ncbi:MAG: hypothetical protein PHW52_01220 [Candidatus Pacebacteria bacterium]|nr:hypothetical protein [Candidatus Paceibacterota bacterium]
MKTIDNSRKGFVVVEALLSASILVIFFTAFVGIVVYNQKVYENLSNRQSALFLAEEGLEATRNLRDADYASLTDGAHGIGVSANKWIFSSASDNVGIFNRHISVTPISSEIKQVDSVVNWTSSNNIAQSVTLTTYLTNWAKLEENNVCWNNPYVQSGLSIGSCAAASETVVQGDYAYMVKAGTNYFSIIDVADPANPFLSGSCANPNCSLSGTLYSVVVQGDYAHISSTNDNAELYTVNISNKASPIRTDTYNATGAADGNVLWIDNNKLYMTREYSNKNNQYEFNVFNLTSPDNPTFLGGLNLENTCTDVVAVGNYAYLACTDTSREFQVVDVSNPASMSTTRRYSLNLPGTTGWALSVIGNTAYIGMNDGTIYSINITNPQAPSVISSYDFEGSVYKITKINDTIIAAAGSSTNEIQIIDVSDPAAMINIGNVNVPGGNFNPGGISYDVTKNRIFASGACLSANSNRELLILDSTCP